MSRTKAIGLGEKNLRIATQMQLANAFRLSVGSAKPLSDQSDKTVASGMVD